MRRVTSMAALCAMTMVGLRAQDPQAAAKARAEQAAALRGQLQVARTAVESKLTKNAPYTAEAVTESVQALADGNRIVTKSATRVYRDSEARTRRELLNPTGSDVVNISISDPVAGNTYVLDPATHTAFRGGLIVTMPIGATAGYAGRGRGAVTAFRSEGGVTIVADEQDPKATAEKKAAEAMASGELKMRTEAGAPAATFEISADMPLRIPTMDGKTTLEDLGQQTIEGVTATGTRTTTEIPAGAIGNEQAIKIVSEQWFSPDLQVLVLTKHADPRTGETTYRLTSIVRAEPARSLFDLPPDYTLKESVIRRQQQ